MTSAEDEPRFSADEAQLILAGAGANQAQRERGTLSRREILEAAEAAGLDRVEVELAIAKQAMPPPDLLDRIFGAPRYVCLELPGAGRRVGPGVGHGHHGLHGLGPEIVRELRSVWLGGAGIRTRSSGSTVRLEASFYGLAGALFGGVGAGGTGALGGTAFGVLLFFTRSWSIALTAALGSAILSFGVARLLFRDVVRRRLRILEQRFRDRVAELPPHDVSSG